MKSRVFAPGILVLLVLELILAIGSPFLQPVVAQIHGSQQGVSAAIIEFYPATGSYMPGDAVTSSLRFKNMGTVQWTFWIGLTINDPNGKSYWFEFPSVTPVTLNPGEASALVSLTWTVPSTVVAGWYTVVMGVWTGGQLPSIALGSLLDERVQYNAFQVSTAPTTTTAVSFDFSISVSPNSGSVIAGSALAPAAVVTVTLLSGSPQSVSFSLSGLLSIVGTDDVAGKFCTPSPSCQISFGVGTYQTAPSGTYPFTITGTGGGQTHSTIFTLTVSGPTTTSAALTDVVATQCWASPSAPNVGDPVTFFVQFEIVGGIGPYVFRIEAYLDGQFVSSSPLPGPLLFHNAGTHMVSTDTPWTAVAGSHTLRWVLNSDHALAESTYDNNEVTCSFVVTQAGKPSLDIKLTADRTSTNVGDTAQVTITVKNIGSGEARSIDISVSTGVYLEIVTGAMSWHYDTLAPGASDSRSIVVKGTAAGSGTAYARATYYDAQGQQYTGQAFVDILVGVPPSSCGLGTFQVAAPEIILFTVGVVTFRVEATQLAATCAESENGPQVHLPLTSASLDAATPTSSLRIGAFLVGFDAGIVKAIGGEKDTLPDGDIAQAEDYLFQGSITLGIQIGSLPPAKITYSLTVDLTKRAVEKFVEKALDFIVNHGLPLIVAIPSVLCGLLNQLPPGPIPVTGGPCGSGGGSGPLLMTSASPANLLVISPSGKAIGTTVGGTQVNEFSGAWYSGKNVEPQIIWITQPEQGEYRVTMTGTGEGSVNYGVATLTGTGSVAKDYMVTISKGSSVESSVSLVGNALTAEEPHATSSPSPRIPWEYAILLAIPLMIWVFYRKRVQGHPRILEVQHGVPRIMKPTSPEEDERKPSKH